MPDLAALVGKVWEEAERSHLIVEDCWYSCPKSGDCCDEGAGSKCTCGADLANNRVRAALRKMVEAWPVGGWEDDRLRLRAEQERAAALKVLE